MMDVKRLSGRLSGRPPGGSGRSGRLPGGWLSGRLGRSGRLPVWLLAVCIAGTLGLLGSVGPLGLPVVHAAAKEDYTYTVRLYSGEHSTLTNGGEVMVYTNVKYGSPLPFSMRDVTPLDEGSKYYVRGIRESGRDNNTTPTDEELAETYTVTEDRDYVVAYGVLGNSVAYTVRYVDADGRELAPTETYYGNIGDRPVVAFLYIDGYIPQAYNLTGTLRSDPADNVFTFTYNRMSQQAQAAANQAASAVTGTAGTGTAGTGTAGTGTAGTGTTGTGTAAGGTAGTGTAGTGTAGTGTAGAGTAGEDAGTPTGAAAEAAVEAAAAEDGQEVDDIVTIDDGEVPLDNGEDSGLTRMSDEATPLGSADFATLLWDVPPAAKAGIFSTQVLVILAIVYVVLRKKGKIPSYVDKVLEAFGHSKLRGKEQIGDAK